MMAVCMVCARLGYSLITALHGMPALATRKMSVRPSVCLSNA